jgi:Mg-chelatase subunit ChlD
MISQFDRILCGALLLCAASQSHVGAQAPAQQAPDKKPIEIFLTASGNNVPAQVPPPSELTVYVDKQPVQAVSLHSAKNEPLLFALLVDVSTSQAKEAGSVKDTAWKIFERLSNEGNRGYLVFFENEIVFSKVPLQPSRAQAALDQVKFGGGTALFDAIGKTCVQLLTRSANPDAPRRAILLLSDGLDDQSRMHPKEAEEVAEKEGVAIFSLSESGVEAGEHFLNEASHATGGQSIVVRNLEEGVTPLLAAIREQWVLTLLPQQDPDQKLHSFAVKSSEKDVRISVPARITF